MFTGLVETAGGIVRFEENDSGFRLEVDTEGAFDGVASGDSIAVNGCCLTVTGGDGGRLSFDLLAETVRLTSFRDLGAGRLVNLERSLLPTTRMGGHFVSGHVDESGRVEVFEQRGADHYLKVSCRGLRYLVHKGSIAIDGISLTVAEVHADGFAVWLIPHTLAVTNLSDRRVGEAVNLEYDLLAKYVERIVAGREETADGSGGSESPEGMS